MDVELFIHGVPQGQDFWGDIKEEKGYFDTMYNNSTNGNKDEVTFIVQLREFEGKKYCYYNYLIYNNVIASDGRLGSYFGISLRIDAYCRNIPYVYHILDWAYNTLVISKIISVVEDKRQYLVNNFSNASASLLKMREGVFKMFQDTFTSEHFLSLSSFSLSEGTAYKTFNLYECTQRDALEAIKRYGKIDISPNNPSEAFRKLEKEILSERDRANETVKQIESDHNKRLNNASASYGKQLDDCRKELSQKDDKIKSLEAEVAHLKTTLQRLEFNKEIDLIVSPIKEPIIKLANKLKGVSQQSEKKDEIEFDDKLQELFVKLKSYIRKVCGTFILFVVIIVAFVYYWNNFGNEWFNDKNNKGMYQDNEYSDTGQKRDPSEDADTILNKAVTVGTARIDIKEIENDILDLDKEYTVRLVKKGTNSDIIDTDKNKWEVEGCDKLTSSEFYSIKIIPKSDSVTIRYDEIIRTLKVKEKKSKK